MLRRKERYEQAMVLATQPLPSSVTVTQALRKQMRIEDAKDVAPSEVAHYIKKILLPNHFAPSGAAQASG